MEVNEKIKEILEEGKKIKEEFLAEKGELGLKIESKTATYILLKSDGLKLHHAGYFIPLTEQLRFGQLFYAFTRIKTKDKEGNEIEDERILPFLIEARYNENKISDVEVKPLNEVEYIDLGETIAQIEKKTLGGSSLPTQLPLEIVEKIAKRKNLISDPLVELRNTYKILKEKLLQHIDQDENIVDIALCWSIATYWNEIFGVMPLLVLIGISGSGKTRFGTALSFIAKKGLGIADPTDANLSRVIDGFKPTLLMDDWDEVMRNKKIIAQSILKHVYKSTVAIPRLTQIGKRFVVDMFSPYAPVIITTSEPITEPQLQRRIIELQCRKTTRKFPNIYNYNLYFLSLFENERKKLYEIMFLLAPTVFSTFESLDIDIPAPYSEIWIPILTVAKLLGEDVYERVYSYARKTIEEKEEEVYREEKLILHAIGLLFKEKTTIEGKGVEVLEFAVSELREKLKTIVVDELREMEEKQFEKYFSIQRITLILQRLGIKIGKRTKKKRKREISMQEYMEILKRLGFEPGDEGDAGDAIYACTSGTEVSKNAPNSQIDAKFETVKIDTHTYIASPSSPASPYPLQVNQNPQIEYISKMKDKNEEAELFLKLPDPISGICSYCGDKKVLTWITKDGHLMCDECRKHSNVTKQTQIDTQIQDTTLKILEIIKDKEAIFGQYIPEDDAKNEVEKLGFEWNKVKDYLIRNGYIITIKPGTISLVV
ncbi:MAG: hypothetical protein QXW01_00275 [Candidatus Aenigmatarchaeota archaeon]